METSRKILIVVILVLFSLILYRFLKRRSSVIAEGLANSTQIPTYTNKTDEGAAVSESTSLIGSIYNNTGDAGMRPFVPTDNLPLSQYVIKSAYNCACSGKYMSLTAMDYVVWRGCRFLDFEIYKKDSVATVAASSDLTYQTITTSNTEPFSLFTVLSHVAAAYGPTSTVALNPGDPLFLHFRIKTQITSDSTNTASTNTGFYDSIASVIKNTLDVPGNNLYTGPQITADTLISTLMGKVIIIIDQTSAPYFNTSSALLKYCNITSGSTDLNINTFSMLMNKSGNNPPAITSNPVKTTVSALNMVIPDPGNYYSANPRFSGSIKNYGINLMLMKFYSSDSNLANYEMFFRDNKSAIVSMADSLRYINSNTVESFETYADADANADANTINIKEETDIYLDSESKSESKSGSTLYRRKTNKHTKLTDDTKCPYSGCDDIVPVNVGADLSISTPTSVDLEKTPANFRPVNSSLGGHIFIE